MKYAYMNSSTEKYIEIALNIFSKLTDEEKSEISYGELVEETANKYFSDRDCGITEIKNGYRFFKRYFDTHFLVKTERIKLSTNKITIDEIKELLNYDLRKNILLKALDDNYRYYTVDLPAKDEKNENRTKYTLIIEMSEQAADDTYNTIYQYFSELIDLMIYGCGGIVIIFNEDKNRNKIIEYIKK